MENTGRKISPKIILALVFLVVVVGGSWYYSSNKKSPSTSKNSASSSAAWATYKSNQYGLQFTYPKDWGNAQVTESSLQTGKHYDVTFNKNSSSSGKVIVALSIDSSDAAAQFCNPDNTCHAENGLNKASVETRLKDKKGLVEVGSNSYTIVDNAPKEKISRFSTYQVVDLRKINASAVLVNYAIVESGTNCPVAKLADNSVKNCVNQQNYQDVKKLLSSLQSI